ncbi:MAG: chromosomal replication initiator protein DnaA [Planctomycetota bacterium]
MQSPESSATAHAVLTAGANHEAGQLPGGGRLDELWSRMREDLRGTLRREQFETWFTRTALVHADAEIVRLAVQNGFTRDWLRNYYLGVLEECAARVLGSARRIEFVVDAERTALASPREGASAAERDPAGAAAAGTSTGGAAARPGRGPTGPRLFRTGSGEEGKGEDGRRLAGDVSLNSQYRFDNFVVGPCNRFAHAACVGVSENPGRIYNPLFLHGSVGLGKTHLLQSLCHSVLARAADLRILYLSCETFVNHFIGALEGGDLHEFRTKYRNVDVLVVDDIHLLANKERTQEEFFHTFNTLYNAGKQIVLSSDSPPVDIPTLQSRLVSRFKWGLVTEIEKPCYETRMAILKRKSRQRGRELPDDVARLLAERIDTNIRELEGAVTKVLGFASLSGQSIDQALVRQCLSELFLARRGQPSIEDILGVVTERFAVKLSDLQSRRRTNAVAYPRQIGMYLARRITRMSLEQIGGFFGGRDHSTVLHAVRKITRLAAEDPGCQALLGELCAALQAPPVS